MDYKWEDSSSDDSCHEASRNYFLPQIASFLQRYPVHEIEVKLERQSACAQLKRNLTQLLPDQI